MHGECSLCPQSSHLVEREIFLTGADAAKDFSEPKMTVSRNAANVWLSTLHHGA